MSVIEERKFREDMHLSETLIPTVGYGRFAPESSRPEDTSAGQLAAIKEFVNASREFAYVATYFDEAYTGREGERPEFVRMMNDVRQKKIRCIVVKELSLFGRNFVEAAYYVDTIFPFLGVRLIALADDFDSARKEDMEALSLAMRRESDSRYSRILSKKIWESLRQRREQGSPAQSIAPFGYIRNARTRRNEVDPEMAFYVQMIYQWKLMGLSFGEIADRLELLEVPTPRKRLYELGLMKTEPAGKWNVGTVRLILSNQTYVGDTVSNKTSQALFEGREREVLPPDEWQITPNTHPALIARDDFERVQELLGQKAEQVRKGRQDTKAVREQMRDELQGLVYCADCGGRMEYARLAAGAAAKRRIGYYVCRAQDPDRPCMGHQITERLLKMLVMDQLMELTGQERQEGQADLAAQERPDWQAGQAAQERSDWQAGQAAQERQVRQAGQAVQERPDWQAGQEAQEGLDLQAGQAVQERPDLRAGQEAQERSDLQAGQEAQERSDLQAGQTVQERSDWQAGQAVQVGLDRSFDAALVKKLVGRIEVDRNRKIRIFLRTKSEEILENK